MCRHLIPCNRKKPLQTLVILNLYLVHIPWKIITRQRGRNERTPPAPRALSSVIPTIGRLFSSERVLTSGWQLVSWPPICRQDKVLPLCCYDDGNARSTCCICSFDSWSTNVWNSETCGTLDTKMRLFWTKYTVGEFFVNFFTFELCGHFFFVLRMIILSVCVFFIINNFT